MAASQISFSSFAASLLASAQQEFDFSEAQCTPPVQQAAVAVVAHPLAVDDGECSGFFDPGADWWSLREAYLAYRRVQSDGSLSNGCDVLLSLANHRAALDGGSNTDRVRSYGVLVFHAQHAIGAGC